MKFLVGVKHNAMLKTDKRKSAKTWFIKGCWYDSDPAQVENAIAAYKESIKIDNTYTMLMIPGFCISS
jgi:hypothetical protein